MLIEVIIYDRIGNYQVGQIVEIPDGVFLRALLMGGKADVINPPDWSPDLPIGAYVPTAESPLTQEVQDTPKEVADGSRKLEPSSPSAFIPRAIGRQEPEPKSRSGVDEVERGRP